MATVLFNPTHKLDKKFQESLDGFYMGRKIDVGPGKKVKVQDGAARHLLNELGPRGLISLDYDDAGNEEERAKEGLERNRAFKIKQLNDFNEKNAARKHRGLEYLWPTVTIKLYAEEIGVKLVESYQIDDAQLQEVQRLKGENTALKEQMTEMNEKMTQILDQLAKPETETETKSDAEPEKVNPVLDTILNEDEKDQEGPLTKEGKRDKRFRGG